MAGRVLTIKLVFDFSEIKTAFKQAAAEIVSEVADIGKKVKEEFAKGLGDLPAPEIPQPKQPQLPETNRAFDFNQVVQSVRELSGAVDALSAPFRQFDKAIRDIGSLGVKNFADLKGAVLDFSKTVPDSAADIASAIGEGIGSGVIASDAAGNVDPAEAIAFAQSASQLAIAGGSSINKAVSGIAATLNAYGLQATETNRISDILFNTFNLGVTSIDDLSGYLSQVTPVASAAGVKFEQVAAAIATMTKQGIKTPDATTKIRALLVELQKPAPALNQVLEQAGVSIDKIASGELSLQSASAKIGATITALGKSAPQVFSSIEAATTVLSLSGNNAVTALSDLEGIAQRGTVAQGFAVQAEGAEVRLKTLINNVQAGFIGFFDTLGTGFTSVLGAASQVAPTLSTFVGLKQLLPEGLFDGISSKVSDLGKRIATELGPSVKASLSQAGEGVSQLFARFQSLPFVERLSTIFNSGIATAKTFAINLLNAVIPGLITTDAVAGTTTFSFQALWTAITGPIGLVVAGIIAIVAILVVLYNTVEPVRQAIDGVWDIISDGIDLVLPVFEQIGQALIDIGDLILTVLVAPFKIGFSIVTGIIGFVVSGIEFLIGLIPGLGSASSKTGSVFTTVFEAIRKAVIIVQGVISGIVNTINAVTKTVSNFFNAVSNLDFSGAIDAVVDGASDVGNAFVDGFQSKVSEEMQKINIEAGKKALEEQLRIKGQVDFADSLEKLKKDLENAGSDAERNDIAAKIAARFPEAVAGISTSVDQATGEVTKVYEIANDKIDDYIEKQREAAAEGGPERQAAVVKGLQAQAAQYDTNVKKLDDLGEALARAQASGSGVEDAQAAFDEQQALVQKGAQELQETLKNAKVQGLLDNLGPEAQAAFDGLKARYADTLGEMEGQIRDQRLGEILTESASIKGSIDQQNSIGEWIAKYKAAKDETERNNIARVIAQQVPQAVSAYDKLGNATEINIDRAMELASANEGTYSDELASKQSEFVDGLKGQADEVSRGRDQMAALQKKIKESSDPREVQNLQAEYVRLRNRVEQSAEKLGENVEKGKQVGLITGDVKDLGEQFGFTAEQVDSVSVGVEQIKNRTQEAVATAADLAVKYKQANDALNKSFSDNFGAIRQLQDENQALQKELTLPADQQRVGLREQIKANNARIAELRAQAKREVKERKEQKAEEEALAIDLGEKEAKVKKDNTVDLSKNLEKIEKDAAGIRSNIRIDAIADETQREREKRQKASQDQEASLQDNLRKQLDDVDKAVHDKKPVKIETEIDGQKVTITDPGQIKEAFRKATVDASKANEEKLNADLAEIDRKGRQKQLDEVKKTLAEEQKLRGDGLKQQIEQLKADEQEIKGESEAAALDRLAVRTRIFSLERAAALSSALAENKDVANANADLQLTLSDLAKATSDEERARLSTLADQQRKHLAQVRADVLANNGHLLVIQRQFQQQQAEIERNGEKELARGKAVDRIRGLSSVAAQEKELALLALNERLQEELEKNEGNQAKITESIAKAAAERRQIEEEYLKKTNILYRLSFSAIDALRNAFDRKRDREREEEIRKERDGLKTKEQDLRESLIRGEILLKDFNKQQLGIIEDRQKLEEQAELEKFNFSRAIKEAGVEATAVAEQQSVEEGVSARSAYTDLLRSEDERRQTYIKAGLKKGLSAEESATKASTQVQSENDEARVNALNKTVTQASTSFLSLVAQGKDAGAALATVTFDALQQSIPALVSMIFGQAIGTLGPILGPIAAGVLTAAFYGLVAVARSAVGAKDGEVPIRGRGGPREDREIRMVSPSESILRAEATTANLDLLRWLNENPGRKALEYPGLRQIVNAQAQPYGLAINEQGVLVTHTGKLFRPTIGTMLDLIQYGSNITVADAMPPIITGDARSPRIIVQMPEFDVKTVRERATTIREIHQGTDVTELRQDMVGLKQELQGMQYILSDIRSVTKGIRNGTDETAENTKTLARRAKEPQIRGVI